jgi:antitoxin ParD1/3/4
MAIRADLSRRLAALTATLVSDADAGRVKPAEDVLYRLEAKYKALAEIKLRPQARRD